MKKILFAFLLIPLLGIQPARAVEATFVLADEQYDLQDGENLTEKGFLQLNDDIKLVFEGGNTNASFNAKSGYIQIAPNTNFSIVGTSEDINITSLIFTITANSYRFYTGSSTIIEPGGELTWDSTTKQNIWIYDEGANSVKLIPNGTVLFTTITIEYSGGVSGDDATDSTPKTFTFTLADFGWESDYNLVTNSPLSMNEDIQLVFESGNTDATYKSSGYAQIPINTPFYVNGTKEDVVIKDIIFKVTTKSNRLYDNMTTCEPTGTFTWDESTLENHWSDETGSNSIKFTAGNSARITAITVTYIGGKAEPSGPVDPEPDPEEPTVNDNLLSTGFDTTAEFAQFTIINVESGSNTWQHSTGNPYAKIENDLGGVIAKDDYLVSPALELKAGKTYRLSFHTWRGSEKCVEKVAAYLLKSADNITDKTAIIPATEVTNVNYRKRELTGDFNVDADGTYYVAIHACSDAGMHYLYVDNVEVSRGVDNASPAAVADYVAKPSTVGENNITLTFTAPKTLNDGSTTLEKLKSVNIYRDNAFLAALEATPGQKLSFTDVVEKSGDYIYSVTAVDENAKSLDSRALVHIGLAKPEAPTNLVVKETTPGTVELTWDAVTTNIYGHEVDPSIVTYNVYDQPYWVYLEGVEENKATFEYVAEGEFQKNATFSVKAKIGSSESDEAAESANIAVGKAFELPYFEPFANTSYVTEQPVYIEEDANIPSARWRLFTELDAYGILPVTFDRGLLAFIPGYTGTSSKLITGKIFIDEATVNPYFSLFYYTTPGNPNSFSVEVNGSTVEQVKCDGDEAGWQELLVNLAEFKGQDVRLGVTGYCESTEFAVALDNFLVRNEFDEDLAIVRSRIPNEMKLGADHQCNVKVTNHGVNTSGDYKVTVAAEGTALQQFDGTPLKRGETADFNFSLKPDVRPGETVLYTVTIDYAADENTDDNTAEIDVEIPEHFLPSPAGLAFDGDALTWDAFAKEHFPARNITESFEAYDEFEINKAGEWQFIDADNYPTFGMEDGYQSYPHMYEPMAFIVFNNCDNAFKGLGTITYDMYNGGQCMASMAINCDNLIQIPNEDWMISPELSGNAQTISLYARSSSDGAFLESFVIKYTTGDDPLNTAAYKTVGEHKDIPGQWKQYTASLPEGAKYFAIVNVSDNKYWFFVDYVEFEAAGKPEELTGYDVYVANAADSANWTKVNEVPVAETQFALGSNDAKYVRVHALFANGVETQSEPLELSTTAIEDVVANGESTDATTVYYNLNGVRFDRRPTTPGIYIVSDANGTHKVLIER